VNKGKTNSLAFTLLYDAPNHATQMSRVIQMGEVMKYFKKKTLITITAITFQLLGLSACGKGKFQPLSSYNNSWEGKISFDNQTVAPISIDFYTTKDIRDSAASETGANVHQYLFAEFKEQESGKSYIASGDSAHYDYLDLETTSFSPIDRREFIDVQIGVLPTRADGIADPVKTPRQTEYINNLSEFMAKGTTLVGGPHLAGEKFGNEIRGVVYIEKPDCTGACKARIGSFQINLKSPEAPGKEISDYEIETDHYRFGIDKTGTFFWKFKD
jgi:hypothetical protein